MIGIAGTENDFLLSLPVLKTYMDQFKEVRNNFNFTIQFLLQFMIYN